MARATSAKLSRTALLLFALAGALGAAACREHAPSKPVEPASQAAGAGSAMPQLPPAARVPPLPRLLSETGLYLKEPRLAVDPRHVRFTPRYPLWTDGAEKVRYLHVPAGAAVDASEPEHFRFPAGTKLWKEFRFGGRRSETRYIERLADGSFRYASYRWNESGSDAELVPSAGVPNAVAIENGARHDLPSQDDCRACHEGRSTPVLGFTALQLGPELAVLAERRVVVNLPAELAERPPSIHAPTSTGRAALGYLLGNCAHCHNSEGPLRALDLDLDQPLASTDGYERILRTVLDRPSRFRPANGAALRVARGRPRASTLLLRMQARDGVAQMPPLGTKIVDRAAVDLISRFIEHELAKTGNVTHGGSS